APSTGRGGRGMVVVTSRPPPGYGWAVVSPWWARAMARTMDRPRPVPRSDRVRWSPRRRNGWNRSSMAARAMGGPVRHAKVGGAVAVGAGVHLDPPARVVVPDGVVDEVGGQPFERGGVA